MANAVVMQASELSLAIVLIMFIGLGQMREQMPQFLGSVGWHGGKTRE